MDNDKKTDIRTRPDAWMMMNVSGISHEAVREYLRRMMKCRERIKRKQAETNEKGWDERVFRNSGIRAMFGESYSGEFIDMVAEHRISVGKAPIFFVRHKSIRYQNIVGIYQHRSTWGKNRGLPDPPFFFFAAHLKSEWTPPSPIEFLLSGDVREVPHGYREQVFDGWREYPYGDLMPGGLHSAAYKALTDIMPRVPKIDVKRYWKSIRHSSYLNLVGTALRQCQRAYVTTRRQRTDAEYRGRTNLYTISSLAVRDKEGQILAAHGRQTAMDTEMKRALEVYLRGLVQQASDILDTAVANIPEMYKDTPKENA